MSEQLLSFTDSDRIGRVAMVDTSRLFIDVEDHALLTQASVGQLVAVQGQTQQEYLIGLIERVTRDVGQSVLLEEEDESGNIPIGSGLEDTIRAVLIGTYRSVDGGKKNIFKRGADSFPQIDRECYLIFGSNLQNLMNLLSKGVKENERLDIGKFVIDPDARAILSGDKFFQRHAAILGSTGSGKSWTVALLLEKASKLAFPNIIVLDLHGEYAPLADRERGFAEGFRIAGPGDLEKPADDILFLPHWLLNREEMVAMLVDRSDQNAPNQATRLTSHVRELKEQALIQEGKTDVQKTFTVDSPIPFSIKALLERLRADDVERVPGASANRDKGGEWYGKLTRLIGRLEAKLDDRRYGFLFQSSNSSMSYGWLADQVSRFLRSDQSSSMRGIKIVDFSEVPSDVRPVVVGVFARLLYDVQFWMNPTERTPFSLVCDEAHLYLPVKQDADSVERRALETFERIAKEGRKYGVSIVPVSQRPSDVSRTILSQCNNFLVLRLTNAEDQNVVRRLVPDSMVGLTEILPLLDTGEGILLGDAILLPSRVRLDIPSVKPSSATCDIWTDWSRRKPNDSEIRAAVESLRRQTRQS